MKDLHDEILAIVYKHLPGKHDQKTHGRRGAANISIEGVHPAAVERIKSQIGKAAKKANVPSDIKIVYKNEYGRVSQYGGVVAADYRKDTNTITVYRSANKEELPGILAHEYGHHIFRTVQAKGNTQELVKIVNKYDLYSKPPDFSSYVKTVWNKDLMQGINEAVSEVYRLYSEGKSNLVPEGWRLYADEVRKIYDNLPK